MIRLICGDGSSVALPQPYFKKMALFKEPKIAKAASYKLRCKASNATVNLLLGRVYEESSPVTITDDNFNELRNLAQELGFTGLDKELRAFQVQPKSSLDQDLATLNERVTRHDKLILELQRQVQQLSSAKRKLEPDLQQSFLRQFESLERKVDEVSRTYQEKALEVSRKEVEKAL